MKFWPVTIETTEERLEVLVEARADRAGTCRDLVETYVRGGYGPIALALDPAAAPSFAALAAAYPARRPLLITIGPEPVEAPAGPRGQVTALGDLVRRN